LNFVSVVCLHIVIVAMGYMWNGKAGFTMNIVCFLCHHCVLEG